MNRRTATKEKKMTENERPRNQRQEEKGNKQIKQWKTYDE